MRDDWAGQRLGQLELVRKLGSGGMSEVWLARHAESGREVAVKILPQTTDRRSIDRLRREAESLARIRHANVVPVHEVGELDGVHYYVMDLVAGRSLEEVLAEGPLACARAAEIARQAAEALAAAHDQGVIHRDVKPGNLILDEGDRATLVDFGIALSEVSPTLTNTGDVLGTPFYMAPEQARGDARRADARTDVWGVGATLYEMITGKKPFGDAYWLAVQMAVLESDPVPPRNVRPDCPPALETIVLRCLEKDPARRYPTARDLADDLARMLAATPIAAQPPSRIRGLRKHLRRHRVAWVGAGAGAALLAAGGLAVWAWASRADERPHAAEHPRTAGKAEAEAEDRSTIARHRAALEAAEAASSWDAAIEAARALGDATRVAALEKLRSSGPAFVQDFAGPWDRAWRIEAPRTCEGPTPDGAIRWALRPGDRALALPVEWDGSSFELSAALALPELSGAQALELALARDGGAPAAAATLTAARAGRRLTLRARLAGDGLSGERTLELDPDAMLGRTVLALAYVPHLGRWQVALRDPGGRPLIQVEARSAIRPSAGRYTVRWSGAAPPAPDESVVDLYQIELRAPPAALRVVAPPASDPPPICVAPLPHRRR